MVGTFSPSRLRIPLGPRRCCTVTAVVVSPQIHRLSGSALCFCVCAFARFLRFRVFAWWICRGGDLFADRSLSCGLPLLIRCRGTAQAHADAYPVNNTPYDGCEQTVGTGWLGVGFGVSARAAAGAATCWQSLRGHARRGRHRWRGVRRGIHLVGSCGGVRAGEAASSVKDFARGRGGEATTTDPEQAMDATAPPPQGGDSRNCPHIGVRRIHGAVRAGKVGPCPSRRAPCPPRWSARGRSRCRPHSRRASLAHACGRGPKTAVPTRMMVEPSAMAISMS